MEEEEGHTEEPSEETERLDGLEFIAGPTDDGYTEMSTRATNA